jgi:hypothetical protein
MRLDISKKVSCENLREKCVEIREHPDLIPALAPTQKMSVDALFGGKQSSHLCGATEPSLNGVFLAKDPAE